MLNPILDVKALFPRITLALLAVAPLTPAAGTPCDSTTPPQTLHLSPEGDDRADGTANAPLASLAGTRNAIRRLRAEANHAGPVRVLVSDGRFPLREPVVFESRDGGSADAAVTYEDHNSPFLNKLADGIRHRAASCAEMLP